MVRWTGELVVPMCQSFQLATCREHLGGTARNSIGRPYPAPTFATHNRPQHRLPLAGGRGGGGGSGGGSGTSAARAPEGGSVAVAQDGEDEGRGGSLEEG